MIKVLAAEPRSKIRSGDEAFDSHSTGKAAPPPNLTRLVHNTASYAGYLFLTGKINCVRVTACISYRVMCFRFG